jgi:hypothetical protein
MFLDCKLFSFVLWAAAVMAMSTSSCGTRSTADESSSGSPMQTANGSPAQLSPSPRQNKTDAIRDVDFKNFTYPWYPSFLKSRWRELTLHDGKLEIEEDRQTGIENLSLELDDVSYVNLRGDTQEEAIVTIAGIAGVNSFLNGVFIYDIEKEKPKLLWQHETGDRANGGLRRIAVESGMLTLEEYARSEGDGGLCCPKIFIRSNYRWSGNHFQKISSETLPNEYKNAEFLGYGSSHP